MANYPFTRVLLSIHTISSSPTKIGATTAAETTVPEYSDVVIIFICLLCALICTVGFLGVIQWTCLKRVSTRATSDVEAEAEASPSECFKKKVVESLPRVVYKSPTSEGGKEKEECVICLSEFVDGEEVRVLPRCAHVFHVGCIDTWFIASNSLCCPSCRQILVVNSCHKCKLDANNSVRPPLPLPLPQSSEVHFLP